jgi:aerobic-type carbon monoxide dehydrogenase small subunit (CoxS/CutS family)
MKTNVRVNNTTNEISLDSRVTLLDALRDVLGLPGTKGMRSGRVRRVHGHHRRPASL